MTQPTTHKITPSWEDALRQRLAWKAAGEEVVFTNGCFDILHQGHVNYLEASRLKGQRLILGLNSDDSIARIKGPLRPIVPEHARAAVLAALQCVDMVVFFDDDTPESLIKYLTPDILTKGADYAIHQIVGADHVLAKGGRVETLPLIDGYSTTAIIEKIRHLYANGGKL